MSAGNQDIQIIATMFGVTGHEGMPFMIIIAVPLLRGVILDILCMRVAIVVNVHHDHCC
jgi:hypothetical protein